MVPNNVELQLAATAATCLAVWFDRTERCGRYLTAEEASTICTAGLRFIGYYEALAVHALRIQVVRFKVIPSVMRRDECWFVVDGLIIEVS